ncbi:MAG: CDP-alcohol phosphatidyltransferase family protein [Candidatus Saccharibacteria bacterium]
MRDSKNPLESIRNVVRHGMMQIAKALNKVSGGRLNPNAVTLFGFAMHLPIAVLIARGHFIYAAILLVIFGLFDALDGQLARLQNRASQTGMLLDSVTDRMKEVIIYIGIGYFFVWSSHPNYAVWTIAACGASVVVSYINAWGEVVTKDIKDDGHVTNKAFRGGLMTFDVRMFVIIIGLLANQLPVAIVIIAVLAWFTAFGRLYRISGYLKRA